MRGLFVTGTDTGVGKTALSAALLAAMAAAGEQVAACKPVLTGTADPPGAWPADDELLAAAYGGDPAQVTAGHLRFALPASPHLAARREGHEIDPQELVAAARGAGAGGRTVVVEGVGGLLVPLGNGWSVRDLAAALGLPVLVAARPGLGTLNHTLLTLEAARGAGLRVAAVVLTPWPDDPNEVERSNLETLAALDEVRVHTLARIGAPDPAALARAGATLPWREWLSAGADGG